MSLGDGAPAAPIGVISQSSTILLSQPISQREIDQCVRELQRAVAARRQAEQAIAQEFHQPDDPQRESLRATLNQHDAAHRQLLGRLEDQHQQRRQELIDQFDAEQAEAVSECREVRNEIERQANDEVSDLTRQHEDARWVAQSVLDETSEDSPKRRYDRVRTQLEKSRHQQQQQLEALSSDARSAMEERRWSKQSPPPPESAPRKLTPLADLFHASVEGAREELAHLQRLRVPKLFVGVRWLWLYLVLVAGIGAGVYFLVEPSQLGVAAEQNDSGWVGLSAGAGCAAGLLILLMLYAISAMQVSGVLRSLYAEVVAAGFYHQQWGAMADRERQRRHKEYEAQQKKMERQLNEQLERFEAAHQQALADIEARKRSELSAGESRLSARTAEIAECRAAELEQQDQTHQQQIEEATRQFETEHVVLQRNLDEYVSGRRQAQQNAQDQMRSGWNRSLETVRAVESASQRVFQGLCPDWEALTADTWVPPTGIPPGLRLGHFKVDLSLLDGGLPNEATLVPQQRVIRFPTVLPFPSGASLLLKTDGPESRRAALQAMQVGLLRLLTLLPPGKLRLTILDPVGLGESFSGLMHLADFDDLLITSRIWTETAHFEARLADLTEHMENILQKYLRNEFSTIEAYNEFAGEVAEPYHVLVVADFPHKFSEQAARRLASVAASGPRCGVYLIMSADASQPVPHGFDLADVEAAATTLTWQTPIPSETPDRFAPASEEDDIAEVVVRNDDSQSRNGREGRSQTEPENDVELRRLGDQPAFYLDTEECSLSRWPIVLDKPPPPATLTQIVKTVGEASKDVRRVEVSFRRIAPPPDDLWSRDSRSGIDLPLGRAGAMKLQHLRLGKGTSQHMLVAGKTGSGKSTFFHALITNAALYYSPDELEFYLVDFKKGVEFKAYAGGKLPHARVIAIESDREFGISVLQRLDALLHERGELFRETSVQDIAAYRDAQTRCAHATNPVGDRRVPGVLCRRRSVLPASRVAARPARQTGPSLWDPRDPRIANARGSLLACPEYPGTGGGPSRTPVQRIRRPFDPQ